MQGRVIDGPLRRGHLVPGDTGQLLAPRIGGRTLVPGAAAGDRRQKADQPVDVPHRLGGERRDVAAWRLVPGHLEGRVGLVQPFVVVAVEQSGPVVSLARGIGLLVRRGYALVRRDRIVDGALGLERAPLEEQDAVELVAVVGTPLEIAQHVQRIFRESSQQVDGREPHSPLERQVSPSLLSRHQGVLARSRVEVAHHLVVLSAEESYLRPTVAPREAVESLLVGLGCLRVFLPVVSRPADQGQRIVGERVRR